jgi:hypothetical protein
VRVCEELVRVARAGYVETPTAASELTRGIQSPHFCGWQHHRWLVEARDGGLVFFAKPHHIHSPLWPAVRSPRLLTSTARDVLRFEWTGSFPAREEVRVEEAEIDAYLMRVIDSSTRRDPLGTALRRLRTGADGAYRGTRVAVGRAARRR